MQIWHQNRRQSQYLQQIDDVDEVSETLDTPCGLKATTSLCILRPVTVEEVASPTLSLPVLENGWI